MNDIQKAKLAGVASFEENRNGIPAQDKAFWKLIESKEKITEILDMLKAYSTGRTVAMLAKDSDKFSKDMPSARELAAIKSFR
jgi:hypothetical protein